MISVLNAIRLVASLARQVSETVKLDGQRIQFLPHKGLLRTCGPQSQAVASQSHRSPEAERPDPIITANYHANGGMAWCTANCDWRDVCRASAKLVRFLNRRLNL